MGIRLAGAQEAWGREGFEAWLKAALESLDPLQLPLQRGLRSGSMVSPAPIEVMVMGSEEGPGSIRARVGVFYRGIIAGCNCADDPSPVDETSEYLVLQLEIDPQSGQTQVVLDEAGS